VFVLRSGLVESSRTGGGGLRGVDVCCEAVGSKGIAGSRGERTRGLGMGYGS
jgi:hypothetical protein